MEIPTFSQVAAISELLITAAVLYVIISNLRGRPLAWKLLLAALLYESALNIPYMIRKLPVSEGGTSPAAELSPALTALAAFHGMLSLLMFLALWVMGVIAYLHMRQGRRFFQEHPVLSLAFIAVWIISVASGELLFILRYLT